MGPNQLESLMNKLALTALMASAAALAGCATASMEPIPIANTAVCGNHGYVDVNNDGQISGAEWNTWRSGAYSFWDMDKNGRVERSEFERCWAAGGFYRDPYYNAAHWNHYWTAFDANNDGWLSADEYWSAGAWTRIDANRNGIIDSNDWMWWG
jgi:hypothetical protein